MLSLFSLRLRLTIRSSWPSFRRYLGTASALALLATSGCSEFTEVCTRELGWRLTPTAQTLRVGESFKPDMVILSCGGRDQSRDTMSWSTEDTHIVAVDSVSGRVSALAVGQAVVTGRAQFYGVSDDVKVTVVAP